MKTVEIKKIKVLIADDHLLVREGLVVMINTQAELEVSGVAADGHELVELANSLLPDVILADTNLPSLNGIEATSLIHKKHPEIRIILMSDSASESTVIRALRNGALGFLIRQEDFQHVLHAIRLVMQGERYLSRQVVNKIIDLVVAGTYTDDNLDEKISTREKEILQLIVEGYTSAEIGEKLDISKRTVETHRTNIMRKLGLTSQIDIIKFAIRYGLLSSE
jgi:DNA-binding NarL/FixJ family response regulator